MVVHNLAGYVAYHQQKLREQNQREAATAAQISPPTSTPTATANKKKGAVNQIRRKSSFETSVTKLDDPNKLVVVDCFATWCGPCKTIAPVIAQFSEMPEYSNVSFVKVDVDESSDVAAELGVRAMPTFLFFKNGEKIDEVVGANPAAVKAAIEKHK